jgi:thioesterase domain-containing protein
MDNPALIYEAPFWAQVPKPPTPLVLMHDGGGLTFSYHCLNPTNRSLYGVHNTHFDEGGFWDGGLPEMASHYLGLVAEALPGGGDIILGGT